MRRSERTYSRERICHKWTHSRDKLKDSYDICIPRSRYALCFYVVLVAVTTMHAVVLVFTLNAKSTELALSAMGPFYILWFQFRGVIVKPSDYNPALRWLINVNPSRMTIEVLLTEFLAGKTFVCEEDAQGGSLEKLCPLPGDLLIKQNDINERLHYDIGMGIAWLMLINIIMCWKVAGWNSVARIEVISSHAHSQTEEAASTSTLESKGDTPALSSSKVVSVAVNRVLSKQESVTMSQDIAPLVDSFMHEPVCLQFEEISVRAEGQLILQNVSGSVLPGGMLGIMGPSGAGKSTLLNVFCGSSGLATSGNFTLNGRAVSSSLLRSRQASYVAQTDILYEELTVRESFHYAAELQLGHTTSEIRAARIDDVMKGMHLRHRTDNLVNSLSGGERRRLSIGAYGLLTPARLMLLDEPTTGLSATDALELMTVLSDLCVQFSFTVVMTIHQPRQDIFELLDQIVLIAHGKPVYSGNRADIEPLFRAAGHPLSPHDLATNMMEIAANAGPCIDCIADHTATGRLPVLQISHALPRPDI